MGLHVCTHFLVKRDKQCVLKRLINDTYLFERYNVFNTFITSFILNSPWSYIWWLRTYIPIFRFFVIFSNHREGQQKKTHVFFSFWCCFDVKNSKYLYCSAPRCCAPKWENRVCKIKLKSTCVPWGQLSYWCLQNLE